MEQKFCVESYYKVVGGFTVGENFTFLGTLGFALTHYFGLFLSMQKLLLKVNNAAVDQNGA